MSKMKSAIIVSILFSSMMVAQSVPNAPSPSCNQVLKIDWILYEDTKDETIDSVTVCDNGSVTAYHSFTAPAFGSSKPEPTKWDYRGEMDKAAMSDLKKVIGRNDITRLPDHLNTVQKPTPVDSSMRVSLLTSGGARTITVRVPYSWCDGEESFQIPDTVRDLICLFADLSQRTKSGNATGDNGCGCKSLHDMASNAT